MLSWGLFIVIPDGSGSFSQGKLGEIYIKNHLNLVKKAQNVYKSAYFSSWNECPPGHTKFHIVQCWAWPVLHHIMTPETGQAWSHSTLGTPGHCKQTWSLKVSPEPSQDHAASEASESETRRGRQGPTVWDLGSWSAELAIKLSWQSMSRVKVWTMARSEWLEGCVLCGMKPVSSARNERSQRWFSTFTSHSQHSPQHRNSRIKERNQTRMNPYWRIWSDLS